MPASIDKKCIAPSFIKFEVGVIIEKDDTGFIAYCPVLKGLVVEGNTEKEVKKNFECAFISYINSALKHGDPLPICSSFKVSAGVKPIMEKIEVPIEFNCNSLITA